MPEDVRELFMVIPLSDLRRLPNEVPSPSKWDSDARILHTAMTQTMEEFYPEDSKYIVPFDEQPLPVLNYQRKLAENYFDQMCQMITKIMKTEVIE